MAARSHDVLSKTAPASLIEATIFADHHQQIGILFGQMRDYTLTRH
jgi:hypothetical protein